jgi:hypothetical protein
MDTVVAYRLFRPLADHDTRYLHNAVNGYQLVSTSAVSRVLRSISIN